MRELGVDEDEVENYILPGGVPLFPAKIGEPGYLGKNKIYGKKSSTVCLMSLFMIGFSVQVWQ